MVAQAQQQGQSRQQTRAQLRSIRGGKGKAPTTMQAIGPDLSAFPKTTYDDVDLETVPTMMAALRQVRVTHIDNYVIKSYQLYHQLDPSTPYVTIGDDKTTQALDQHTHPMLTNFVDQTLPYLLAKGLSVHVSPVENPGASQLDCSYAAGAVQVTWRWNQRRAPGLNSWRRRLKLVCLEGGWGTQFNFLTPDLASKYNGGYPIIYFVHSLLDAEWIRDPNGYLRVVMVGKRRPAGELPDDWLTTGNYTNVPADTELDVYEVWTRYDHGVVIGGKVIKPLTPHLLADRDGSPLCPWVIQLHDPEEFVKGDATPVSTGMTPLKVIVGNPLVRGMIKTTEQASWLLTLIRNMAADSAFAERLIKGEFTYDPIRRVFMMEDTPESTVQYLNNTSNLGAILQLANYYDALMEGSVGSKAMQTGQPLAESGVAAGMQTALPKARREDGQVTLEEGAAEEAMMIITLIAANCPPTTAQQYEATFNRPLQDNMRHMSQHPKYNPQNGNGAALTGPWADGQPLAMSELVTGRPEVQLTTLNFEHIRFIDVSCRPYENLAREAKLAQGNVFLQMGDKSPYDEAEILGTWFDEDDPQRLIQRRNLSKLTNNPNLPFQDMDAIREWALSQMASSREPMQLAQLVDEIDQSYEQQMILLARQRLTQLQQNPAMGSAPGAGQASGQPPGSGAAGVPGQAGAAGSQGNPGSSIGSPMMSGPGNPMAQPGAMQNPRGGIAPQSPMQQMAPTQMGPNPGGIGQPMPMMGG